jgi:hypothetical protein
MILPNDYARCVGIGYEEDDGFHWGEGCEDCLRRNSPGGTVNMTPPSIITFECPYRLVESDFNQVSRDQNKAGKTMHE